MGELAALAARGMPPTGRGIYLREDANEARRIGASFALVNGARADAAEQARAVGGAWLYSLVSRWRPETWRDGLAELLAKRRQLRALGIPVHGIVGDAEGGWPELSPAERVREVSALGAALAEVAQDMRVGFTTYPNWPGREALVGAAGDAIWYSPQLYGRTSQDPADIRRWYELWTSIAGAQHCIPSIAGWPVSDLHRTPQGFADYLTMLPPAAGFIAFDATGPMPSYIAERLATYEPGGSAIETQLLGLRNAVLRPAALAIGVAIIALVVMLVVGVAVVGK